MTNLKNPITWAFISVILFVYVFATAGISFLIPVSVRNADDAEAIFKDGIYKPFGEARFSACYSTGMTLFYEGESDVTDWVMVGELNDKMILFILPAGSESEAPESERAISYILRYPNDENSPIIDSLQEDIYSMLNEDYGYTRTDYANEIAPVVLEAAHNARTTHIILFIAAIVIGAVALIIFGFSKAKAAPEVEKMPAPGEAATLSEKSDDPWDN